MFKKGMAYLLPTTKAQNCLYKNKGTNKLDYHKGYLTQDYLKNSLNAESFHLCIIDSEKINDLDNINVRIPLLFISSDGTSKLITYSNVRVRTPGEYYRILATTDESLVQLISDPIIGKASISFPKPSISFIKKYIEEYNRSNIIIDVLVEYEIPYDSDQLNHENGDWSKYYSIYEKSNSYKIQQYEDVIEWSFNEGKKHLQLFSKLKINPKDNTITIKKLKDSFTLQEINNILDEFKSEEICKKIKERFGEM